MGIYLFETINYSMKLSIHVSLLHSSDDTSQVALNIVK